MRQVFARWDKNKTHCPQGHDYDAVNTRRGTKGERLCKTCTNARTRAWLKRQGKSYRDKKKLEHFAVWLAKERGITHGANIDNFCLVLMLKLIDEYFVARVRKNEGEVFRVNTPRVRPQEIVGLIPTSLTTKENKMSTTLCQANAGSGIKFVQCQNGAVPLCEYIAQFYPDTFFVCELHQLALTAIHKEIDADP